MIEVSQQPIRPVARPDIFPPDDAPVPRELQVPVDLLQSLQAQADALDANGDWPAAQFAELARAGVLQASVFLPGDGVPAERDQQVVAAAVSASYLALGSACLSTTFVLTQRNGACERIQSSRNTELQAQVLPEIAGGEKFVTLGISHLTTSRQHTQPAVTAAEVPGGFTLNGEMPWVTGAVAADELLCGATLPDGRQLLALLPGDAPGLDIQQPPQLLALNASQTGAVGLHDVFVPASRLVAGPVEQVMRVAGNRATGGGGGTGSLNTSALAIGHAAGVLQRYADEVDRRADLRDSYLQLLSEYADLTELFWQTLFGSLPDSAEAATGSPEVVSSEVIRQRANSLALRSSQAYLTAVKGAGFLASHPAGRLVREAMFFLVWSCPQPVMAAQIRELACAGDRWDT